MEQITPITAPDSCRLVLVRHGQARSSDGSYGPQTPLSPLGRRQAEFEMGTAPLASAENRPDLLLWQADHTGVPGGETLREFGVRIARCVEAIVRRHLHERVVVVSHAGTMEAALRWAVGLSAEALWQHEFVLPNASLTELECWPDGRVPGGAPRYVSIAATGVTTHLAGLVTDL